MEIRVRYAPSPTGYLHIGGARTAIFNYLFAKHNNGKFIVRIEDTDLARNVTDGIASQLNNLRWLGLDIDETIDTKGSKYGPYQQTQRLDIYRHYADKLIDKNHAYHCFCTVKTLEQMRKAQEKAKVPAFKYDGRCAKLLPSEINKKLEEKVSFAIRLKSPKHKTFIINDIVRGEVTFNSKDIGDFVIIKTNGVATYNFAVVIDDYLMKISHVFRGAEHLSNTPRQLIVYDYFKWIAPKFGHLTLITNQEGKKLSKRDGSLMQFIEQYRNQGYLPEALFNFISLLGWNPHEEREIFSKKELIKIFNSDYFSKSPGMFDIKKLLWVNNHYIKELPETKYLDLVMPFVKKAYDWKSRPEIWWKELLLIYQKQLMYGAEITELIKFFLQNKITLTKDSQEFLRNNSDSSQLVIKVFSQKVNQLDDWNEVKISDIIKQVKNETKISGKLLYMTIRIACSWQTSGPELPKTIKLLGKKNVLTNIKDLKF